MKNIFSNILCLLIVMALQPNVQAQSLEAGYGHFGAMIYWQGSLPKQGKAEIRRTGSSQDRRDNLSWTIRLPESPDAFLNNVRKIPPVYEGLFPFTEKSATFYVEKLQQVSTTATLPTANVPNVLFAIGLGIWDTTLVSGQTYQYQIYIDDMPVGEPVKVEASISEVYDWMPTYFAATNDELIIRCKWKIPYERKSEVYSYLAYRTAPFQPDYQLHRGIESFAVSGDTIIAVFMDTLSRQTPGIYQYVIRPVNRFGLLGPVSEYAIGSNFPPAAEPIMTYMKATGQKDQPKINVEWRLNNPWRIRTMRLYRSRSYDGPYALLAHVAPDESPYVDAIEDVMESYFYYFEMDDIVPRAEPLVTAKVTSVSDYVWPAQAPDSIFAEVDGKAITIHWKRGGFQDRGYYVLRATGYGDPDSSQIVSPFIHVTGDSLWYSWSDTSSLLTPDNAYTYAVISESIGYDKSLPSKSVTAQQKVKQFMPPPKDLKLTRLHDETFLLRWSDLSADETLNHLGYRVYKKDKSAKVEFVTVHDTMLFFESNYIELQGVTPEDEFVVKAFNIFGDESVYSESVSLAEPFFYRFGPQYLMGKNEETGIQVRWNKPLRDDISGYVIYRMNENEKPTRVATPGVEETTWLDTKVKNGETYYYFITAQSAGRMESEASEVLTITRKTFNN